MSEDFSKVCAVATVQVLLTLGAGCGPGLPEYSGPLCEKAASGDWSPAAMRGELIVTTPGLEGWGDYLRQHTYAVHGSCGQMKPGVVAHTYSGRSGYRTDVFELFYDRDVVSRAGFLIHEVGHAAGLPGHIGEQDLNWEHGGAYRLQLEFLAAVYYARGLSEAHREAARAEFTWIMRNKFVEASDLTLQDFE